MIADRLTQITAPGFDIGEFYSQAMYSDRKTTVADPIAISMQHILAKPHLIASADLKRRSLVSGPHVVTVGAFGVPVAGYVIQIMARAFIGTSARSNIINFGPNSNGSSPELVCSSTAGGTFVIDSGWATMGTSYGGVPKYIQSSTGSTMAGESYWAFAVFMRMVPG